MLTGVSGRTRGVTRGLLSGPARGGRGYLLLGWGLLLAAAFAGLFFLALFQSFTAVVNSDGAGNVLQAAAMLHGNPLLRGWWTSDVSFYTTELPEYALVTWVRGLAPGVVHICGALSYTLTVLLAALAARGRTGRVPRRAGLAGAAVAAGILLAPSLFGGTQVFLENPDHAGTAVPVLAVLLLTDQMDGRAGQRWYLPAAIGALLAIAQVGDELVLVAATVPVAVVSALRLLTRGSPAVPAAAGADAAPPRLARWLWRADAWLLAAAAGAAGAARLTAIALTALGGFEQRPIPSGLLAPLSAVPGHARVLWSSVTLLFGANPPGRPGTPLTRTWHAEIVAMAGLHVPGLVLGVAGLIAGIAMVLTRRADRVTQVVIVAVLLLLAAGLFGPLLGSLAAAHEVAIVLPLGAVLAGRTLPSLLPGRVWSGRRGARLMALALGIWLTAGVAQMSFAAAWPSAPQPERALAAWLVAHHEREGLAGYWQADLTTVQSGGRVLVAPLTDQSVTTRHIQPRAWESSSAWYRPGQHRATFVIAVTDPAAGAGGGLTVGQVRTRFGRPAARYRVGRYVVMTYRYNLLTRLTIPGPAGPR